MAPYIDNNYVSTDRNPEREVLISERKALLAREQDNDGNVEKNTPIFEIHREPQARKRLGLSAVCQTDLPSFRTLRM